MKDKVLEIWPEINWIKDEGLKTKTLDSWVYAIENSPLEPKDLEEIPFSLLIKDCSVLFEGESCHVPFTDVYPFRGNNLEY